MVYPAPGTQTSVALCWFLLFVPRAPLHMFKILHLSLALSLLFVGTVRAQSLRVTSGEWPQWRGPNQDAVSTETGLLREWPEGGPPLQWRATGLGSGYSTLAISGANVFTIGQRDEIEYLIALDFATGKEIWASKVGVGKPNSTPTVHGNRVYALGNDGSLICADAITGREIWRRHLVQDFGGSVSTKCGFSESPLVDGHLYFRYENGVMALVEATPNAYILKSTFNIPSNQGKGFPHPVVAGRSLFLRDEDGLFCCDLAR